MGHVSSVDTPKERYDSKSSCRNKCRHDDELKGQEKENGTLPLFQKALISLSETSILLV
jgi:hypothetical protein